MSRANRQQDPINRVKCVVDTCEFYNYGDHCVASSIEIQPPQASDTEETDCATFKPRS